MIVLSLLLAMPYSMLRAGIGDELAAMHVERMGGVDRIHNLQALRVEGRTYVQDNAVEMVMWAERPNHLRVESRQGEKRFVQAYDGAHAPWQSHSAVGEGAPKLMGESEAREFIRNADFDGPLIGYSTKGFTVDYAGEEQLEGRAAYKLLVMGQHDEILFLWLDKESYLLVKRLEYHISPEGRRVGIATLYKDYRPVGGVPQPYRVETQVNGRLLNMVLMDKIEANPRLPNGIFSLPAAPAESVKEITKAASAARDDATAPAR
ncbi:MAG: hypothetical protein PHQ04_08360 [Opitutaceae bacterium]|nr:hypothetical protein [Opitutaceae bacterium]